MGDAPEGDQAVAAYEKAWEADDIGAPAEAPGSVTTTTEVGATEVAAPTAAEEGTMGAETTGAPAVPAGYATTPTEPELEVAAPTATEEDTRERRPPEPLLCHRALE